MELVDELQVDGVLKTPRIISAFSNVDRIDFVPEDVHHLAYINEPISIGFGQTISQPYTVAFMLELLAPSPGERILDIGSGSGWQTALLAYIVSHDVYGRELPNTKTGYVVGLEIVPELVQMGIKNVSKYNYIKRGIVEMHCLNAEGGFPRMAPYNRIIAAATVHDVPYEWKTQLADGGTLVFPLGSRIVRMERNGNLFSEHIYEGFSFVPFIREDDHEKTKK